MHLKIGLVKLPKEVNIMLNTQQSNSRRLIYSLKQMREGQNQGALKASVTPTFIDENYEGEDYCSLEINENECYVLGYN
ncbi:hypothetical protein A9Q74_08655 [Colwellia sp. 39_35_sub15_T18]|nr:hypothetical protein A9Q74_08655 [Colwellia sp. 39_35_sub15_T18]